MIVHGGISDRDEGGGRDGDHIDLRIVFEFDKHQWSMLRRLIDRLNENTPTKRRHRRRRALQEMDRLSTARRPSEPFFVDRVLGSTVDRFSKPDDCKIGQLLGDAFKISDLVEFSHDQHRIGQADTVLGMSDYPADLHEWVLR